MNQTIVSNIFKGSSHAIDGAIVTDSFASETTTSFLSDENILVSGEQGELLPPYPGFQFHSKSSPAITPKEKETHFIRSLGAPYSLKRPLLVTVSSEDDEVKATIPQLELYTFSSTVEEAIEELTEELIDLCDVLFHESNEKLTGRTLTWKLFLQQYAKPNAQRSNK